MWLVHLCRVIASFLVNMLFLKIKSVLFIIRLFFSNTPLVEKDKYKDEHEQFFIHKKLTGDIISSKSQLYTFIL
jgi:hypothetical protein